MPLLEAERLETSRPPSSLDVAVLDARFSQLSAAGRLRHTIEDAFAGRVALVSSFGADSAVLLHMVAAVDPETPVVFVDTGHLFPETLTYRDHLVERFGLKDVRTHTPEADDLVEHDGENFLWSSGPDLCCRFRKVLRATIYRVRSQKGGAATSNPTVASLLSGPIEHDGVDPRRSDSRPADAAGDPALHASDMDMRKKVLSLYRWTSGSRGLAV